MQIQSIQKRIVFIAVFMSFCACLQIFLEQFIYWRPSLPEEFWRFWTAHWVHVGWVHYLLNIVAFICLPFIFPKTKISFFILLLLLLPPLISLSFYYFLTDVEAYAGLSGVLHGAYVAVASEHLRYKDERRFASMVLLLIVLKLIWENTMGSKGTAELIGSPVLVEAHLLGVVWGVIFVLFHMLIHFIRRR